MQPITYNIRLDASKPGSQAQIYVKKGDVKSRQIIAYLFNNSVPYTLATDMTVMLRAIKPDGTLVYTDCIISGSTVQRGITQQMLAVAGIVQCELVVLGASGEILFSPTFDIYVEESLYSFGEITSSNEFTVLTDALDRVEELESDVEAEEATRIANEAGRVNAESIRVTNENARIANETGRVNAESIRVTNENTRIANETGRVNAESLRVTNENTRTTNETGRVSAENTRDANETTRIANETARVSAENSRVALYDKVLDDYNNGAFKGDKGDQGDQGDTGETGPPGPQGIEGIKGDKGDKGDPGTGLHVLGVYDTLGDLQSAVTAPAVGDMYNVGSAAPHDIYMWDGAAWINLGPLQGEKGDKGDKGDQGDQGPTGAQGLPGKDGDKGDKGDTGNDGVGVPLGGVFGAVLRKNSAADHDTVWEEVTALSAADIDAAVNAAIDAVFAA